MTCPLRHWRMLLCAVLATPVAAPAADWYVATNGNGSAGTSWATAYTNVQTAINAAGDGDTIYLAAHTFIPPSNSVAYGLIVWTNKGLSLLGGYAADGGTPGSVSSTNTVLANTNAASTNCYRVLYLGGVTNGALARVTIQGGKIGWPNPQTVIPSHFFGAGLYASDCSNLVLSFVTLDGNYIHGQQAGQMFGGGLYALNSWGVLTNCLARNNWLQRFYDNSSYGGGLHLAGGGWTVQDSVIRDNTTYNQTTYGDRCRGVGIYVNGGTHTMKNCLISRNFGASVSTPQGEGVYVENGTVSIENCTLHFHRYEGLRRAAGTVSVRDSIIWDCGDDVAGTVTLQNSDIQDGDAGTGCISQNPLFERGLYLATNSPCVNAGSQSAAAAGLGGYSTRADGVADSGTVDTGYHFTNGVIDYYVSVSGGVDSNSGGLHLYNTTVRNCLIYGNNATNLSVNSYSSGDGVYAEGGTVNLESCTLVANQGQGVCQAGGAVALSNCVVWANGDDVTGAVSLAFCDIEDGDSNGVNGCISADPRLQDPAVSDYRLRQGSPCIDRGTNLSWMMGAVDLAGKARLASGWVDIGAYERPSSGTIFLAH